MNNPLPIVLPKQYHYYFFALFGVMLLIWVALALLTTFFGLLTYFSSKSLATPTSIETAVMLVISVIAALKLKHLEIIGLTEQGVTQFGNTLPYHEISQIEHIRKSYLHIVIIHSSTNDKKNIILLCPEFIKYGQECLDYISQQTGHTI
jgi:hypothetical protein